VEKTGIIAVIGATGYVGGRLVPELLKNGHHVRAVARSFEKLRCRPFAASERLEIAEADVLDEKHLVEALKNCHAAYYLVNHLEAGGSSSAETERKAATNMVRVTERLGLSRIIYLSSLANDGETKRSRYLASRYETGSILASGQVPLTWLRAAPIVGSGSLYFEILRFLVERLPVMITPRWVHVISQPVDISDVILLLVGCLENDDTAGQTLNIVGPDRVCCREAFDIYAEEAGLRKRLIIPIPVTAPRLSAYWINHVTPVPGYLALPLVEGLLEDLTVEDDRIKALVPIEPTPVREGIQKALRKIKQELVETCWSDAGKVRAPEWLACTESRFGSANIYECNYRAVLDCPADRIWRLLKTSGGRSGWHFGNSLWQLRGFIDRLLGGVGLSRGRRNQEELRTGDALDFWRVLLAKENMRLILLAEMKLPGEAALIFNLNPVEGGCELVQIARFLSKGLSGLLYWHAMAPFHDFLFKGMLKNIACNAGCGIRTGPEKFEGVGEICRLPDNWGQTG